jgi:hypothetical protein
MSGVGTLANEFPDYPEADVPAFTKLLTPQHWHNDSCPSWVMTARDGDLIQVYVDFVDVNAREIVDDSLRFTVLRTPAGADHSGVSVLETDDETAVANYLQRARA